MSDDVVPLSYAELQKLDDGIYISEVRRIQAGAVNRTKETADKSWKIAAAVAALVLGAGFTDRLRESPTWVQVIGALAILLWLVVTGMFLRVNQIPPPDHPAWNGPRDSVQAAMAREVAEAENDRVRKREVYAKLQNRTTLKLLSHRFKIATGWSMVALLVTGVGFIATAVTDDERFATGVLLLTPDGSAAVLDACPTLTAETLKGVQARLDTNKVGVEGAIRVSFEAGACYNTRAHLYIDGKLIRGLVVP